MLGGAYIAQVPYPACDLRPRRHRGDPDDAPTMALAEFLAPSVIVTQDSVLSRFGVAVIEWIPVVQDVMRIVGLEATAANALTVMDWALRLLGTGAHRLAVLARSNPLAAAAAVSALLWWCHRKGYLTRDNWRRRLSQAVREHLGTWLETPGAGRSHCRPGHPGRPPGLSSREPPLSGPRTGPDKGQSR
ncbi:hypothetical protein ACFYOG_37425 [Streptomyces sp. NPDC007818]|uniref:hypothetical protein n=1 Tax=Streptomyces sp. NPDC007818 TaxID=3364780 RepID=UPI0036AFE1C5